MKKLTKKLKWLANVALAIVIVIAGVYAAIGLFNKAEEKSTVVIDKVKSIGNK